MNSYADAEIVAREHLNNHHAIFKSADLPDYANGTWTPVEVLAQMKSRGDCIHEDIYKVTGHLKKVCKRQW